MAPGTLSHRACFPPTLTEDSRTTGGVVGPAFYKVESAWHVMTGLNKGFVLGVLPVAEVDGGNTCKHSAL